MGETLYQTHRLYAKLTRMGNSQTDACVIE